MYPVSLSGNNGETNKTPLAAELMQITIQQTNTSDKNV